MSGNFSVHASVLYIYIYILYLIHYYNKMIQNGN